MTLRYHFTILFRRIIRLFRDNGLHPVIGALLVVIVFALLAGLLYIKIDHPGLLLIAMCLVYSSQYASKDRNDFLRGMFSKSQFIWLSIIEGIGLALPFMIVLIVAGDYLLAFTLVLAGPMAALFSGREWSVATFPTPFGRFPFEFASGIRKYILLIPVVVTIFIIGLSVGNFNLALFCLFDVFLSFLPFYAFLEPPFFVWNHRMSASSFLKQKWKQLTIYCLPLPLLMAVPMFIKYPNEWLFIIGVLLLGYFLIVAMLFAKYSSYPNPINVPQAILFCVGLAFPPVLILVIIIFWRKSVKRLNLYLQ